MSETKTWQELLVRLADQRPALLDIRSAEEFVRGHLPGAVNKPVPVGASDADLAAALPSHVLPPRHAVLMILAAESEVAECIAAWLRHRGRIEISVMTAAPDWAAAPDGVLVQGAENTVLWEAPPWLTGHVDLLPAPSHGPVVDLGCGSGRAAVWLAARGYEVCAVDRHPEALEWAVDLATDLGVSLETLCADLTVESDWPGGPWSVAVMLRFLHRPLVDALPDLVRPGGVVVLRTFRWVEGAWTLPRRQFCLEQGELNTLFDDRDWEILDLREDDDADGRPGAGIVARRRG